MPRLCWLIALGGLLSSAACKDPETAAAEALQKTAEAKIAEGREALASGKWDRAIAAFKQAASAMPKDPQPLLMLADAHRQAGNDAAAVLALKQAEELHGGDDPLLKRQRAELFRRMGQTRPAIATLLELFHANQLTDAEVLVLSRMQARQGEVEAAWKTLERVQLRKPDDPEAKVVEAEILLISGEELLAAKLMDRLLEENPGSTGARVLRARYFLNSGYPEMAEADLALVGREGAKDPEVVALKAKVLNQLRRYDEAVRALQSLLDDSPRNPELLAQLAETKLNLGQTSEALTLVEQGLTLKPKDARALYVRGRVLEAQGELKTAVESYQHALRSDPSFGPALSRTWRIFEHRGEKIEAMSALERLLFMNEASIDEKVALAGLYADSASQVERGKKLIAEALRHEPKNGRYLEIQARLVKAAAATTEKKPGSGVIIMKGGR